jgi:hypothetical protein
MVERRSLVLGIAFTIAAYFILSLSEDGGVNAVIAFFLGGAVVGFIIEEKLNYAAKIKYSLTHGAIIGITAGVISIIILIIQLVIVGLASILGVSIITSVLILLAYDVVAALAGAILGNFIKLEYARNIQA